MSDLKGRDFFNKKGGGNKLNIICSLTENLDEFKNQHIETCFEVKQVCTSIFVLISGDSFAKFYLYMMLPFPTFSYSVKKLPFSR